MQISGFKVHKKVRNNEQLFTNRLKRIWASLHVSFIMCFFYHWFTSIIGCILSMWQLLQTTSTKLVTKDTNIKVPLYLVPQTVSIVYHVKIRKSIFSLILQPGHSGICWLQRITQVAAYVIQGQLIHFTSPIASRTKPIYGTRRSQGLNFLTCSVTFTMLISEHVFDTKRCSSLLFHVNVYIKNTRSLAGKPCHLSFS